MGMEGRGWIYRRSGLRMWIYDTGLGPSVDLPQEASHPVLQDMPHEYGGGDEGAAPEAAGFLQIAWELFPAVHRNIRWKRLPFPALVHLKSI